MNFCYYYFKYFVKIISYVHLLKLSNQNYKKFEKRKISIKKFIQQKSIIILELISRCSQNVYGSYGDILFC